MRAFILVHIADSGAITFGDPMLDWVKQQYANVVPFDLDAQSDELMQQYALRLLREATASIVCLKAEGQAAFGRVVPLLQELLMPHLNRLVVLQGEHLRLQRVFEARPDMKFTTIRSNAELKAAVQQFFSA
ncbi:hypothetical protein [Pontibacter sp. SGAir0037]|uniref:hypothetical protein n=1 Tax=Pontibacter sp. SGAir0037 TaxID=2571030 RepID=UPI0010CD643E|nr:hypothetical protein [Pontibacter sp. SGAir0037]QCR23746.1 hypothetical protein C1N53_16265 [Pontibacter sp. SGAir0037]